MICTCERDLENPLETSHKSKLNRHHQLFLAILIRLVEPTVKKNLPHCPGSKVEGMMWYVPAGSRLKIFTDIPFLNFPEFVLLNFWSEWFGVIMRGWKFNFPKEQIFLLKTVYFYQILGGLKLKCHVLLSRVIVHHVTVTCYLTWSRDDGEASVESFGSLQLNKALCFWAVVRVHRQEVRWVVLVGAGVGCVTRHIGKQTVHILRI